MYPLHELPHGMEPYFVGFRARCAIVLRPNRRAKVSTNRASASWQEPVGKEKGLHHLHGEFLPPRAVPTHGDDGAHLILKDVGVFYNERPAAV